MVRLLKPLSYYQEKYGSPLWGFTKLFLLMEKQHNRGQDGAGVACVKLDMPSGSPFMFRERNIKANPLDRIFRAPGILQGHVVDFVSVFGPNAEYFQVFNVADSAITIGGISLVITALLGIDFDGTSTRKPRESKGEGA